MIDSARVTHVPMEGRGGVADYRIGTDELTYHAGSQAPHAVRQALSGLLGHPADRLRVVIPDIGGAFGQKAGLCREDLVVCAAAKLIGRPVKWVEDRVENLAAAGQAREETIEIAAAVKDDGTILALDVKMRLNQGAYPLLGTPAPLFAWIARTMIGNAYRIDSMRWSLDVYATNKAILFEMSQSLPGARVLEDNWGQEHMAIAVPKGREAGQELLNSFVRDVQSSGLLEQVEASAGLKGAVKAAKD